MLTGKQVRVKFARNRIMPAYIDASAPEWQEVAERLLELFRGQEGRTRGEMEADAEETFASDPQQLVLAGLAKVLEDRCEFDVISGQPPDEIRALVFGLAAQRRTIRAASPASDSFDRNTILLEAAEKLHITPEAVDIGLFADLKSEQRLVKFKDISAERLLQRYNVALAQAILLRSTRVVVEVKGEAPKRYRQLFRLVKFHRLIANVQRTGAESFRMQLDGPMSLFTATQKYGLQLALFLPAVLHCKEFKLEAELLWGVEKKPKVFNLSADDGLVSPGLDAGTYVPPELAMFVDLFCKKIADWEIDEETEVLPLGEGKEASFWVPDYRLTRKADKKVVYLEVLGFWRKGGAVNHLNRLRKHARQPFILAVSEQLHIENEELEGIPAGIHRFRNMPLPEEVVKLAVNAVQSS